MRYTKNFNFAGLELGGAGSEGPWAINGLGSVARNSTTDNRISNTMFTQFDKYRVRGFKYRIRCSLNEQGGFVTPNMHLWFLPVTIDNFVSPNSIALDLGHLDQWPGARWKALNKWNVGGPITTIKGYISTKRFRGGPDTWTSDMYLGGRNLPGVTWADPAAVMNYWIGWARTDGSTNPIGADRFLTCTIQTTYYVEFSQPSRVGIE